MVSGQDEGVRTRWLKAEKPGQKACAAKQRNFWESFQKKAEESFGSFL